MAKFSLDLDDFDFGTDDHFNSDLSFSGQHIPTGNELNPAYHDTFSDNMSPAIDDPVQDWLNQQIPTQEQPSTNVFEQKQKTALMASYPHAATFDRQSRIGPVPRHDSNTSLQSLGSAVSSSSRRGPRIVGGYLCNQCDRAFDVPSELRHHERNHISAASRPYACHCGQRFLYPKDLNRHMQRKHSSTAASASLSRTQSLEDVMMSSADDFVSFTPSARLGVKDRLDAVHVPDCRCECHCKATIPLDADQSSEEARKFSESAITRLDSRLETLQHEIMALRKERIELAGAAVGLSLAVDASPTNGIDLMFGDFDSSSDLRTYHDKLLLQQRHIEQLKLEVLFATKDAAFWMEECNHYAWFLRKIPKAPRPPIYAIPKQTGRVSLVQYAKGWLGAIGLLFKSSGTNSQGADLGSQMVEQLVEELDRLALET